MFFVLMAITMSFSTKGQVFYPFSMFPDLDNDVCIEDSFLLNKTTQNSIALCPRARNNGFSFAPYFLPAETDNILSININLIFLQRSDGTGNFEEYNSEHQQFIDDVVVKLNNIYSSFQNPNDLQCYTGSSIISDSKIRFVDHRYYIRSDTGWNNQSSSNTLCPGSGWYLEWLDQRLVADPDIPAGINVYFTENLQAYTKYWIENDLNDTTSFIGSNVACARFPSSQDFFTWSSRIHMLDHYSKYWWMRYIVPQKGSYNYPSWETIVRNWHIDGLAMGLAHELGHCLGLYHPKDAHLGQYVTENCFSTLMNPSGGSPRNFLPPIEVGHIYTAAMTTNLRNYIAPSTYLGTKELDTIISFPRCRFYHSLHLNTNAEITMNCDVIMPHEACIEVKGLLQINGAELQSADTTWRGICVKQGGVLILSDVVIKDYDIHVEKGGQLIIKDDFQLSNHSVIVDSGGYLCIDADAHLNLMDEFALIHVASNAILGISDECNCVQRLSDLSFNGNGQLINYSQNRYLQNLTIQIPLFCGGNHIAAGAHVTTECPAGDVVVESGGNLIIQAETDVVLCDGFEIKQGGVMSISNY